MSEEIKNEQSHQTKQVDNQSPAEAEKPQVDNKIPYERFKQKVDEVNELKRKLAEIEKERDEAERKKLEEQNEYKALYEKAQAELEKIKMSALDAKKDALLAQAGYTSEQIERYRKYLTGETDEELKESLKVLMTDIPPKKVAYVDPSVGNTEKQQPKPKDSTDIGRSLFKRLKEKGKIR